MYLVMEACPAPRRDDGPRSTPPSLRLPPVTTTVEATPLSVQKEDPIRAIKVKNSARIWPWPRWKGTRWRADFKSHRKHTRHRGSQHCRSTLTGWLSRWVVKGDPNNQILR